MEENKEELEPVTPAPTEEVTPAEETALVEEAAPTMEAVTFPTGEPSPAEEPEKPKTGKIAIAAIAAVAVLVVLFVLVLTGAKKDSAEAQSPTETAETIGETVVATVPADGNPEDVTCKGSYTVTDEQAKASADTVVATIGDTQLTNGQLQVYYWSQINSFLNSQQGYMFVVYGLLDYTQPLDTQIYSQTEEETLTWQQVFLERALLGWQTDLALEKAAQEAGVELSQEDAETLANLTSDLDAQATSAGMADARELIAAVIGSNASVEDYTAYCRCNLTGGQYYLNQVEAMVPTLEDLEAYFAENEEAYAESGITRDGNYVDIRHILFQVEGGTTDDEGNTTYSDADWEACRVKAQAALDAWLAGDATEDSFAALANEQSEDPGSNTAGGLYEDVYEGQMVQPFNDWCFDESRVYGDYGLVQTGYGYHVMFFVNSTPIWQTQAESDWITDQTSRMLETLADANPMEVHYDAIELAYIDFNA